MDDVPGDHRAAGAGDVDDQVTLRGQVGGRTLEPLIREIDPDPGADGGARRTQVAGLSDPSRSGAQVAHPGLHRLQQGVEAAEDRHGQDDIAVLAPDIEIPEHIVGDTPDEVGDPVELRRVHS